MPIYEYICIDCKKTYTVTTTVDKHVKNPSQKCQHCGSKNVKQNFSGVSVITSKKS